MVFDDVSFMSLLVPFTASLKHDNAQKWSYDLVETSLLTTFQYSLNIRELSGTLNQKMDSPSV